MSKFSDYTLMTEGRTQNLKSTDVNAIGLNASASGSRLSVSSAGVFDKVGATPITTPVTIATAKTTPIAIAIAKSSNSLTKKEVEKYNNGDNARTRSNASVVRKECYLSDTVALPQHNKSTDSQLVERVQRGDKKAFDLLVLKYQGKVASIVARYVSDRHEVLDVTQESFIKAYRALKNFRGDSAFYTWLYRISINTAKNYLVSKGRRPPSVDVEIQNAEHFSSDSSLKDDYSPEKNLYRTELEKAINQAISGLPENLRVALTLREFEGLSYDEIAEVMGCPVGTVRSRIFRARDAVDQQLRPFLDG